MNRAYMAGMISLKFWLRGMSRVSSAEFVASSQVEGAKQQHEDVVIRTRNSVRTLERSPASTLNSRPFTRSHLTEPKHIDSNAPWLVIGRIPNLRLHFADVEHDILSLRAPRAVRQPTVAALTRAWDAPGCTCS